MTERSGEKLSLREEIVDGARALGEFAVYLAKKVAGVPMPPDPAEGRIYIPGDGRTPLPATDSPKTEAEWAAILGGDLGEFANDYEDDPEDAWAELRKQI